MKRYRNYLIIGCLAMVLLAGCGAQEENPYRVDTVVQIPVDPTEPPTEPAAADETEAAAETEATAEETKGKSTSTGKSSGSKKSSSSGKTSSSSSKSSSSGNKNSSSGNKNSSGSSSKATEPKETLPPETEPAATQPPVTEPVSTEAPTTEAPTEAPTEPPYNPSNYGVGSLEYAVFDAINAYRAEAGVSALSMSTKLCGIAALRAEEVMQVWSHSRPDGRDFTSALSDYGYGYGSATENLVYATDSDAQAMVDKWMSSDSNRANLLSASFTTAGVGVYRSGGMTYVANILVG